MGSRERRVGTRQRSENGMHCMLLYAVYLHCGEFFFLLSPQRERHRFMTGQKCQRFSGSARLGVDLFWSRLEKPHVA